MIVFGDENLYGVDAIDGHLLWAFAGPSDLGAARVGVYPFSAASGRVFAGSVVGLALAIDLVTGEQLWRSDIAPGTDSQVRVIAATASRVYLSVRFGGPVYTGMLVALNSANGEAIWADTIAKSGGRGSGPRDAVVVQVSGAERVIASLDDGRILSIDGTSGATLWTIPRPSTLLSENDTRRLTHSGGTLVATSTGPDMVAGYALASGLELWRSESDQGSATSAISADSTTVFVRFASGNLAAYRASSGQRESVRRAPVGFFYGAPAISGDTLYIAGSGAMFAIKK